MPRSSCNMAVPEREEIFGLAEFADAWNDEFFLGHLAVRAPMKGKKPLMDVALKNNTWRPMSAGRLLVGVDLA